MKPPPRQLNYERRARLPRPKLHRFPGGFEVEFPDSAYFRPRERWTFGRIVYGGLLAVALVGVALSYIYLGRRFAPLACVIAFLAPFLVLSLLPMPPRLKHRTVLRVDAKGLVVIGDPFGRTVVSRKRLVDAWVDVERRSNRGRTGYLALWVVSPSDLAGAGGPHADAWRRARSGSWQKCLDGYPVLDLLRVLRLLRSSFGLPRDYDEALVESTEAEPSREEVAQYVYRRTADGRFAKTGRPV